MCKYIACKHSRYGRDTVEPLYNGQVGAEGFVLYLEVSFIGKFHHNVGELK